MKKMRLVWIGVVCLLGAGPALAETVKLGHTVRPAGMACNESTELEAKVTVDGRVLTMIQRVRKEVIVVASGKDAVTKARISYMEFLRPDGPSTDVVGPTYLVAFDGKTRSFTRTDGKPLGAAERRLLEDDNDEFGEPDELGKAIASVAFEKGKRTAIPTDRLAKTWDSFPQPVRFTLTLTGIRGPNAELEMELSGGEPKGSERISLTGRVVVERATGEVLSLEGAGPFAAKGATGTMKMAVKTTCKR